MIVLAAKDIETNYHQTKTVGIVLMMVVAVVMKVVQSQSQARGQKVDITVEGTPEMVSAI